MKTIDKDVLDGMLFTANITRYATILKYISSYDFSPRLDDADFYSMLENTVKTGVNTKKPMGLSTHFISISSE